MLWNVYQNMNRFMKDEDEKEADVAFREMMREG